MTETTKRKLLGREALTAIAVKSLLPTSASSADLMQLAPALRERAFFSARTTNEGYLAKLQDMISQVLAPEAAAPGEYIDPGTFRLQAKDYLQSIGYVPPTDRQGGVQDLSSDVRLNLILNTNVQMAQGYGDFIQGQGEAILDQWPAQELLRVESRMEPRDWLRRWHDAGGQIFMPDQRMIALKNEPIWTDISAFGLPYPPFDFGSGMGIADVDRDEAMALGLIDRDTQVQPQTRNLNEGLEVSADERHSDLLAALVQSLGAAAEFRDGVLRLLS